MPLIMLQFGQVLEKHVHHRKSADKLGKVLISVIVVGNFTISADSVGIHRNHSTSGENETLSETTRG